MNCARQEHEPYQTTEHAHKEGEDVVDEKVDTATNKNLVFDVFIVGVVLFARWKETSVIDLSNLHEEGPGGSIEWGPWPFPTTFQSIF